MEWWIRNWFERKHHLENKSKGLIIQNTIEFCIKRTHWHLADNYRVTTLFTLTLLFQNLNRKFINNKFVIMSVSIYLNCRVATFFDNFLFQSLKSLSVLFYGYILDTLLPSMLIISFSRFVNHDFNIRICGFFDHIIDQYQSWLS